MGQPDLTQRIAVVTGGGTALGAALAGRLAAAGAEVVLVGEDAAALAGVAGGLRQAGWAVEAEAVALAQPAAYQAVVAALVGRKQRLDIWVNLAPLAPASPAVDVTPTQWDTSLALTVSGAFYGAQAAGRQMLAQGRGVIVNVGSVAGAFAAEGELVHSVCQGALATLTQALGVEWAARGVRVVGVAVGPVQGGPNPAGLGPARRSPLRRPAALEEVAEAVCFLASDEASYVVAETLRVDGGWGAYQLF